MEIILTSILTLLGIVFLLNANPIFTLPTWIVISIFFGGWDVMNMLPVIVAAVGISAVGRYVLARYSGHLFDKFVPKRQTENVKFLDDFLSKNTGIIWPFGISFLYAFSPLPTNALFIVAGAGRFRLISMISGFFLGEFFSNIAYLSVLSTTLSMENGIILGIAGLVIALAILFVDWKKVIASLMEREMKKHIAKKKQNRRK